MEDGTVALAAFRLACVVPGGSNRGTPVFNIEGSIQTAAIYSDPGYLRAARMRISSSQVGGSTASYLCFGPLVADGYGVCYNPRSADMLFPCSALRSCPTTSAPAFRDALEQSLLDMRHLALHHGAAHKL